MVVFVIVTLERIIALKRMDAARDTAQCIADRLFLTESAIDEAMSQIAGFAEKLPEAARAAGFSAVRGQAVYERLAEAMVAQSRVRAKIVDAHNLLSDLKADSFMRNVAIGGGTKDTPPGGQVPIGGRLEVVARTG